MSADADPVTPQDVGLGWKAQLVEDRRRASEAALWGVPGISLAAQAFLFNTGLARSTVASGRLIVGVVGFATAVGTALVVAGQGSRLAIMREWLSRQTSVRSARDLLSDDEKQQLPLVSLGDRMLVSPIIVWLAILGIFAIVDIVVIVAAAVTLVGGGDLFARPSQECTRGLPLRLQTNGQHSPESAAALIESQQRA
jgi:hypothetical protein